MTDFRTVLANLRRPGLLIRAARFGLEDYRRERDLRRVLPQPTHAESNVSRLLQEEERLEHIRQTGERDYPVARHIEVMIALMAEVRLLPRKLAL